MQVLLRRFSPRLRRTVLPSLLAVLSLICLGCGLFGTRSGLRQGYYLPLTVQLRNAPTVQGAQVTYRDACGETKVLPLGGPLEAAIKRQSGLVFEKVVTDPAGTMPVDGYHDVSVGLAELDLVIMQKTNRKYPAMLSIGLDFAYTDAAGTVLYSKKLKSVGRGEVEVTASSCDVGGLEKIAQSAIEDVTDGMAKQLGTSTRIQDAAEARRTGTAKPTTPGAAPPSPFAVSGETIAQDAPSTSAAPAATTAQPVSGEPATLVFRAIIRDENRNQLLHTGEAISVEIEIKNEGPGDAAGVEILISGGVAELVDQIPAALPVGDIPAGDVKRVSLEGKIGTVKEATQAELMLALQSRSPSDRLPSPKKFLVALKPDTAPEAQRVPVDVDDVPKRSGRLKQPRAVGLAVGVGQFREAGLQRAKYAAHDAQVVASYWQSVLGIPSDRVRRLTDAHALKSDLVELFEEWLPKQVDSTTVVYLYVSGRGAVDGATGAVSLVPFDGTVTSGARLYSLRRLHDALGKLPIQRAIVILDLSLEHIPGKEGATADGAPPVWEQDGPGKEKLMWMVGNRSVQEVHPYDPGQHGFFTYELLKGLGGAADVDKDGTILAGELCAYAKGQVLTKARELFGNEQEPICIPGPGQGAMVRLQPVAKLK